VRPAGWLLVVPLLLLAGCGAGGGAATTGGPVAGPVPFAGCAALAGSPSAAPTAAATGRSPGGGSDARPTPMPALDLPCLGDGSTVHTGALRGPAVVNLWASWCAPCREELPTLQRYADLAAGRVTVVGVVTEDSRPAAISLANDLGVRFPALFDARAELRRAVQRAALPVTLFVDRVGDVRHVYNGKALDDDTLASLVKRYLGVVVS
jgi:thiol-disulfide isomerase/thioredoxin